MTRHILLALALLFAATAQAADTPPGSPPITRSKGPEHFKQEKRALTLEERDAVAKLGKRSLGIIQHYLPGTGAERITARMLDKVYDTWLDDKRADKPVADDVIPAFGIRLGLLTLQSCKGAWYHVKDNYGEALAIEFDKSGQQVYPIDSVNKRYSRGERDFFVDLHKMYVLACTGKLK